MCAGVRVFVHACVCIHMRACCMFVCVFMYVRLCLSVFCVCVCVFFFTEMGIFQYYYCSSRLAPPDSIHTEFGHTGRDSLWGKIKQRHARFPFSAVVVYLSTCPQSCQPKSKRKQPRIKPVPCVTCGIRSMPDRFRFQLQVDAVCFRSFFL